MNSCHYLRVVYKLFDQTFGGDVVDDLTAVSIWGPPCLEGVNSRIGAEENGVISAGSKLQEKAIIMLSGMLDKSRKFGDWIGIMSGLLNLGISIFNVAVAHTVSQQPFMALFYLTRILHEFKGQPIASVPSIPPYFENHVFFVLCQALFLVICIKPTTDQQLFWSQESESPYNPEPINLLLKSLNIEWIDINTINEDQVLQLLENCSENIQQVMMSCNTPLIVSLSQPKKFLNSLKKKELITKATLGKLNWLMGSGILTATKTNADIFDKTSEASKNVWCTEGQAWLKASYLSATSYLNLEESMHTGFLDSLLNLDVSTESISQYPIPSLFEVGLDILVYSRYLTTKRGIRGDLIGKLKLSSADLNNPKLVESKLFEAAFSLYQKQLGFCVECLNTF